jgi:hypothetical protein
MADCAAHLVDNVLPVAPYRQWTLSLPYDVRLRIGYDKTRVGDVLALFLRTVFCWQRLQARRAGIDKPLTGAVTLCQRYGSILQFTPHFHSWLPDGVFSDDGNGGLQFHRLAPPSDDDIDRLLLRVAANKRMNLVRFHGVFAPRATVRPALQALLPRNPQGKPSAATTQPSTRSEATVIAEPSAGPPSEDLAPLPPRYRRPWHELLKRVFDVDIVCGCCGSKMHRISHIEDPQTIAHILGHLGLPTEPPRKAPARAPPQCDFDFGDVDEPEVDDVPVFYLD